MFQNQVVVLNREYRVVNAVDKEEFGTRLIEDSLFQKGQAGRVLDPFLKGLQAKGMRQCLGQLEWIVPALRSLDPVRLESIAGTTALTGVAPAMLIST